MAKLDVATTYYSDETAVADADGIKTVIANNFPGYAETDITLSDDVKCTAGTLSGTVTVKLKSSNPEGKTTAKIVFATDGKITVTAE